MVACSIVVYFVTQLPSRLAQHMHARLAFCRDKQGKVDVFITKLIRNDSKNIIDFLYKCAIAIASFICKLLNCFCFL